MKDKKKNIIIHQFCFFVFRELLIFAKENDDVVGEIAKR